MKSIGNPGVKTQPKEGGVDMWSHRIFDDLIEDENDFVGKVAYSIYKQEKVSWINDFIDKNKANPTQEELNKYFYQPNSRPDAIQRYRAEAERSVNEFVSFSLSEDLAEYRQQVRDEEIISQIKTPLSKLNKPFWISVKENVAAGLIASALTSVFSVSLWLYGKMEAEKQQEQAVKLRNEIIENLPVANDVKSHLKEKLSRSPDSYQKLSGEETNLPPLFFCSLASNKLKESLAA